MRSHSGMRVAEVFRSDVETINGGSISPWKASVGDGGIEDVYTKMYSR